MQTGVLRVLRATAAYLWRHRELRRAVQKGLEPQLVRKAVLPDHSYLRRAASLSNALVICGEGTTFINPGWTIVSALAPVESVSLATLAVARGTPFGAWITSCRDGANPFRSGLLSAGLPEPRSSEAHR